MFLTFMNQLQDFPVRSGGYVLAMVFTLWINYYSQIDSIPQRLLRQLDDKCGTKHAVQRYHFSSNLWIAEI